MNNDRELLQQALDALQGNWRTDESDKAIEALRARLAQPENDFNPDWDAMAVMVEEQQRMAKRIEELEARLSQPEPAQCDGGQCGIGGYCKQCPKTQPEREWVGLTDDEIWKDDGIMAANSGYGATFETLRELAHAIEAKLKEKNNG